MAPRRLSSRWFRAELNVHSSVLATSVPHKSNFRSVLRSQLCTDGSAITRTISRRESHNLVSFPIRPFFELSRSQPRFHGEQQIRIFAKKVSTEEGGRLAETRAHVRLAFSVWKNVRILVNEFAANRWKAGLHQLAMMEICAILASLVKTSRSVVPCAGTS